MLSKMTMLSRCARPYLTMSSTRRFASTIDVSKLQIDKTASPKDKVEKEKLAFGNTFSDHMLEVDWCKEDGWSDPVIRPYGPFEMDPASSSLHYALQCFEGMKAYLTEKEEVRLFRPERNMARLSTSMQRLFLPTLDEEGLLDCIKELLKVDRDWVPPGDGYSLYIRPTAVSTHPYLGVGAASKVKVFVILCPVGPYYPTGFAPVSLYADDDIVRAWPGGTGDTKVGGNYAPGIKPQMDAVAKGYSQILWLFGPEKDMTEVGTMNLFFVWDTPEGKRQLVTAPLTRGDILPGVTRSSILELARSEWDDVEVVERNTPIQEFLTAVDEGRVVEAFGAGTAAIVSPINRIHYRGRDYDVPLDRSNPDAKAGVITQRCWDSITGIQYGKRAHEWSVLVE